MALEAITGVPTMTKSSKFENIKTTKFCLFLYHDYSIAPFRESMMTTENQEWGADKPEGEAPPAPAEGKETEASADTSTEEKPVEEEAQVLTLDEWKALRSTRAKPQYNLRKAGEGEDLTRWKKMYALEKKKEGAEEEDEEEEDYDVAAEYPQRVGRQKHVLDIDIQFSDSRRGGGGRGGRGGRGARGDRPNQRGFGGGRGTPRDAAPGEPRGGLPVSRTNIELCNAISMCDTLNKILLFNVLVLEGLRIKLYTHFIHNCDEMLTPLKLKTLVILYIQ